MPNPISDGYTDEEVHSNLTFAEEFAEELYSYDVIALLSVKHISVHNVTSKVIEKFLRRNDERGFYMLRQQPFCEYTCL